MADLRSILRPYHFHRGIQMLRRGYETSRDALASEASSTAAAMREHAAAIENEDDIIDYTDGFVVVTRTDTLRLQLSAAVDAAGEVRTAFAVAFYHHWERSVSSWAEKHLKNFDELTKAMSELGYPMHPRIGAVRALANLLKHDSWKWGEELKRDWPDVFVRNVRVWPTNTGWYEVIDLTDDHVLEVIDVVEASGPPR
jgi:hypothetical protein